MNTNKITTLSLFIAVSLILSYLESFIPMPLPGIKVGFANIGVLTAMLVFGFKEGMIVGIMKSLLAGLFFGRASGLIYSFPATLVSGIVMGLCLFKLNKKKEILSPRGVSIAGSVSFNFVQILIASVLISDKSILKMLPYFFILSIFTGVFIGIVSTLLSERLEKNE